MRSMRSNPPLASTAVIGAVALFILAIVFTAFFLLEPTGGKEKSSVVSESPTIQGASPTQTAADTATSTSTFTPVPTETFTPPPTTPPAQGITPTVVTATPIPTTPTSVPPDAVHVFLIALSDNGASGLPVGCGDSLIDVPRETTSTGIIQEQIVIALGDLFSIADEFYGEQGYYNALHQSTLNVDSVTVENGAAVVMLSGELIRGDECNRPRIEAQIEGTISRFTEVETVQVFVNGTPLEVVLYGE